MNLQIAFLLCCTKQSAIFLNRQLTLLASEHRALHFEGSDAAFIPFQCPEEHIQGGQDRICAGQPVFFPKHLLKADHIVFVYRSSRTKPSPECSDIPNIFRDRRRALFQLKQFLREDSYSTVINCIFHNFLHVPPTDRHGTLKIIFLVFFIRSVPLLLGI